MTDRDLMKKFLEDMWPYMAIAATPNATDRRKMEKLFELCEKHGVPFKTYTDILNEWNEWEKKYVKD